MVFINDWLFSVALEDFFPYSKPIAMNLLRQILNRLKIDNFNSVLADLSQI